MSVPHKQTRQLGEFRIIKELGRGGMGVVFEAEQESLGRRVALKVLPSHISLNPGALARFQREAVTAGRLTHPAIAKVYSVGRDQDLHYFAMELVEGPSLEDCLKAVRERAPAELRKSLFEEAGHGRAEWVPPSPHLPCFAAAAAWIAEVAEALTNAHNEGILHRDLKPSNIILRTDGSPVLVDFGLSQDSSENALTKTGDAVGTPAYMSPEQARGEKHLDARCDVYGLGATLYELVTLRPPFEGQHPSQVMQRILDTDAVDPCKLNPACPRDLANIIVKCLSKKREERYIDTRSLAADLKSFFRGDVVEARAPTTGQKLRRGLRRRRRSIIASAVTAVLLSLSATGVAWIKGGSQKRAAEARFAVAIAHLQAGRNHEAASAFADVRGVLGDARVKKPWIAYLESRVRQLRKERLDREIEPLLLGCAQAYLADPAVREWLEEAKGRGNLRIAVHPPDARVTLRRMEDDGTLNRKEQLPQERMAKGWYLARVDAGQDFEPALGFIEIRRNEEAVLSLRAVPKIDLLPGTVYVAGNAVAGVPPFLIDEHEVTCREYAEFLASLSGGLRRVLTPDGWSDGEPPPAWVEHPVRNVSLQAALQFARWKGGHVPSVDEYKAAGALGGPWLFPWGTTFDAARVVADPMAYSAPRPVGTLPRGASLAGCLDLVGNVSEWVTGNEERVFAAGGSFESSRDALGLSRMRLSEPGRSYRDVGFRLAYYVAPPDSEGGTGRTNATWARLETLGRLQIRTTVEVDDQGQVGIESELSGSLHGMKVVPEFIQLPGGRGLFHTIDLDVDGPKDLGLTVQSVGAVETIVHVDLESVIKKNGGRFDFTVRRQTVPRDVLTSLGGGRYRHRFVVIRRPGEAQYHRFVLPGKARVHSTHPPIAESRVEAGRRVLTFEFVPRAAGYVELVPIEIEFSIDFRSDPLPTPADAAGLIEMFVRRWNALDRKGLRELCDDGFTFGPTAIPKPRLLLEEFKSVSESSDDWRDLATSAFPKLPRGLEVTALSGIGKTVRIEARARAGGHEERWIFTLLRGNDGLHVLDLTPPLAVDTSHQDAEQVRNDALGFSMPADSAFVMKRLQRFDAPMQLRLDKVRATVIEAENPQTNEKTDHRIRFAIWVFGKTLGNSEKPEDVAPELVRSAFPFFYGQELTAEDTKTRRVFQVGSTETQADVVFLTQPWKAMAGTTGFLQKRCTVHRGKAVFVFIASATSDTAEFPVLQHAYKELFDELFAKVLASAKL